MHKNSNKHGAANGYDKELFADNISWYSSSADDISAGTESGIYIITGGAIKLTRTMQEREHTLRELVKMERVRSHLLANNIVDKESFDDYMSELV